MSLRRSLLFLIAPLLFVQIAATGTFIQPPSPSTVNEGDSLDVLCVFSTPANITWEKGQGSLPQSVEVSALNATSSKLSIASADHSVHTGNYSCVASAGSQVEPSAPFPITVHYISGKPDLSVTGGEQVEPDRYRAVIGTSVILHCSPPVAVPPAHISWSFRSIYSNNFVPVTESQGLQLLGNEIVLSVEHSRSGTYKCTASNNAAARSSSVIISAFDQDATQPPTPTPPPPPDIPYDSVCGRVGGVATLDCDSTVDVTWFKDNHELSNTSRVYLFPNGSLHINDIQESDGGVFVCRTGSNGHAASDSVTLNLNCVNGVTVVANTVIPNTPLAPINGQFSLRCSVDHEPGLSYTIAWRHNETLLTHSGRVSITGSKRDTLTVSDGRLEDSGDYTCTVVSSDASPINSSVSITVEDVPTIEVSSDPSRAMMNHTLTLTCSSSSGHVAGFRWYSGSQQLRYMKDSVHIVRESSSSSMLVIKRFSHNSTANYTCEINDELHGTISKSVMVPLSTDLYFTRDIGTVSVKSNDSVTIVCLYAGGKGPVSVEWHRSGRSLVSTNEISVTSNSLTIKSFKEEQEGSYSCSAKDSTNSRISQNFTLSLIIPAYFIESPIGTYDYKVGDFAKFTCKIGGKPKPVVNWVHRITLFKNNSKHSVFSNGTLIIWKLSMLDEGKYTCYFQQSVLPQGIDRREFNVRVVPRTTAADDEYRILGFVQNDFIAIVLGAVAVFFLIITIIIILVFLCYRCCCRKPRPHNDPKVKLETTLTSFERRPSIRSSIRKDNSGILVQSPSNLSNLHTWAVDQPTQNNHQMPPSASFISGIPVSPGPPVPSPAPPSLATANSMLTIEDEMMLNVPNFPRKNLKLGEVMGEGEFGPVLRGVARQLVRGEEHTEVAVKMLMKRDGDDIQPKTIIMDFVNQMNFSSPNISTILGLCTDMEPYYVIYQYLDKGDLKHFLMNSRPDPTLGPVLLNIQLKQIIQQVSNGMSYLYTQQIIHGDLAARNCLISSALNVKIADLGIGHDLYSDDYFDNGTQLLPVRWMAPELLVDTDEGPAFSLSSDIWSFGVLCWEVFSYAQQPYPELTDEEVLRMVPAGHFLQIPQDGIPPLLYSLMQDCWSTDPLQRPPFSHISTALLNIDVD